MRSDTTPIRPARATWDPPYEPEWLPWLLALVGGALAFAGLTVAVANHVGVPGDAWLLDAIRGLGVAPIVWQALSESANIPLIVIGLGMVVWLFATRRRREAIVVLVLLAAITAGSEGVKQLVARPRPSGTDPAIPGVVYSFPSGHVLEALTILGIICVRVWRSRASGSLRVVLVVGVAIWVLLVGVARIGLNAHYPSDVLAGLLGGLAALGLYGLTTRPRAAEATRPSQIGRRAEAASPVVGRQP